MTTNAIITSAVYRVARSLTTLSHKIRKNTKKIIKKKSFLDCGSCSLYGTDIPAASFSRVKHLHSQNILIESEINVVLQGAICLKKKL